MSIKEKLLTEICYFYFEIKEFPFKEAGIDFKFRYGYARILNQKAYLGYQSGYYLLGIYDFFTNEPVKDINKIKRQDFVMNQSLAAPPPLRGEDKWILIDTEPQKILNIPYDLPHMVGSHLYEDNDVVYYYKNGIYASSIGFGVEAPKVTQFSNVKHLEEKSICGVYQVLHRHFYIELLKTQLPNLTDDELKEKMLLMLGKETWEKMDTREKKVELRSFLMRYKQPLYRNIPIKYREKAKNEVDKIE